MAHWTEGIIEQIQAMGGVFVRHARHGRLFVFPWGDRIVVPRQGLSIEWHAEQNTRAVLRRCLRRRERLRSTP